MIVTRSDAMPFIARPDQIKYVILEATLAQHWHEVERDAKIAHLQHEVTLLNRKCRRHKAIIRRRDEAIHEKSVLLREIAAVLTGRIEDHFAPRWPEPKP